MAQKYSLKSYLENTNQADPLLTIQQAAEYLNVSVRTMRRLQLAHKIEVVRLTPRCIRFRLSACQDCIAKATIPEGARCNTTTIPDGVVINDTSVYAIPGTLWMSNPEHFGQGAVDVSGFYDIDAGLFTRVPDGAQLSIIHGGIVGVTAENADMVISKLSNAVDTTITIADGATISVAQYAALQNAIVVYSSNPPELGGNYSVTKVSESDNLSGIRNWTKLTGIPDSQYAKMDSIEKCSGKSFTSEQWQKILPNIKAKKGSYDDYGNEPSDIMIHGTYATWGEAGLAD